MELDLGNFKVLQAIRRSQERRNQEARKSFFRFVKFNFWREKNVDDNFVAGQKSVSRKN